MSDIMSRPLTEQEREKRTPMRIYPYSCRCGCTMFNIDWAMYSEMDGGVRVFCANCETECVPTEPMEYNA